MARIVVAGAGGRGGRAVVAEAVRRELQVTALVRDPARAGDLAGETVEVISGDAIQLAPDHLGLKEAPAGWVNAISPFSAPPQTFDGFDTSFYCKIARSTLAALRTTGGERLVVVGLFATLHGAQGRVLDDAALFPPALKPFAQAHAEGVRTLQNEGAEADWLVLAPPPLLDLGAPVTGRYRLGSDRLDPELAGGALSYADLAVAVLDEIERPTRHREQVAVYPIS